MNIKNSLLHGKETMLVKVSIYYFIFMISVISGCDYFFPPLTSEKVNVHEAYSYLKSHHGDDDVVLLDVRTKDEYKTGHIEGAILLDYRETIFPAEIEKLDKEKRYLIYSKNQKESLNTLELMKELRFDKIHVILGGWEEWNKQRLPVKFD